MSEVIVLHPPNEFVFHESWPVLFTAGPIQGARDWQAEVPEILIGLDACDMYVANPRAPGEWHGNYNGQVDWELQHLNLAGDQGVVMFWLAKEETHYCDRPHGQTSRFELGEWVGRKFVNPLDVDLVVGIEPGFTNERYIRRRLARAPWTIHIHDTLEETCASALSIIRR